MIQPKYKIGDSIIFHNELNHIMKKVVSAYLPHGAKVWEYKTDDPRGGWIKETNILNN